MLSDQNGTTFSVRTGATAVSPFRPSRSTWVISPDADGAAARRVFGTMANFTNGMTYSLRSATADLKGTVVDMTNTPVPFITLLAHEATTGVSFRIPTAPDGSFDIPVFAGTWHLEARPA